MSEQIVSRPPELAVQLMRLLLEGMVQMRAAAPDTAGHQAGTATGSDPEGPTAESYFTPVAAGVKLE